MTRGISSYCCKAAPLLTRTLAAQLPWQYEAAEKDNVTVHGKGWTTRMPVQQLEKAVDPWYKDGLATTI